MKKAIDAVEKGDPIESKFTNEERFKFCRRVIKRADKCIEGGQAIAVSNSLSLTYQ